MFGLKRLRQRIEQLERDLIEARDEMGRIADAAGLVCLRRPAQAASRRWVPRDSEEAKADFAERKHQQDTLAAYARAQAHATPPLPPLFPFPPGQ